MKIEEALQLLKGGTVTYSRAGGGAGSILLIQTDSKISIWIWCYWVIKNSNAILATADDDPTALVGKIAIATKQLEGLRIDKIEFDTSYYNLHFFFEDGYELIVYSESQPEEEPVALNNWELYVSNLEINFTLTCQLKVLQEKVHS